MLCYIFANVCEPSWKSHNNNKNNWSAGPRFTHSLAQHTHTGKKQTAEY